MSTKSILELKSELLLQYITSIEVQLDDWQAEIIDIKAGIAEDSKSSAGDKFETSRERATQTLRQLESQIQKKKVQLTNLLEQKSRKAAKKIGTACLVHSNMGYFFIAANTPNIEMDGIKIQVISPGSPFFSAIKDKQVNDQISFRGQEIQILAIA